MMREVSGWYYSAKWYLTQSCKWPIFRPHANCLQCGANEYSYFSFGTNLHFGRETNLLTHSAALYNSPMAFELKDMTLRGKAKWLTRRVGSYSIGFTWCQSLLIPSLYFSHPLTLYLSLLNTLPFSTIVAFGT